MDNYFQNLTARDLDLTLKLDELKPVLIEREIPIIKDDSLEVIRYLIESQNIKKILEIGCAVGYSALRFVSYGATQVVTIERNQDLFNEATASIKAFNKESFIKIINADALEFDESLLDDDFDMIFIDAAKAQYQKFFDKYTPKLKVGGLVVCDNVLFHDLVGSTREVSKNVLGMITKMAKFNENLKNNSAYSTTFLKIGDGLSISVKKV